MVLVQAFVYQRKSLVLILVKQTQNFASFCIKMVIVVICLLMEKKYLSLKSIIKNVNFPTQLCPGIISNEFGATIEISLL